MISSVRLSACISIGVWFGTVLFDLTTAALWERGESMTIKDLAEKTGYGVATISRVLNNQPNVSEKARQIIMQAVDESGFQLNSNAKQLKQQHSTSILVVVKGTMNEMFSELVEIIQPLVAQTSYPLRMPTRCFGQFSCARRRSLWGSFSLAATAGISWKILKKLTSLACW